jgi:hypothetical protein
VLRATYLELQFSRRSIIELVRTSLVMSYPPFNPFLPPTGEVLPVADDGTQFVVISTSFLTTPGATMVRHGNSYVWNFEWGDLLQQHTEPVPARHCEVTQRVRVDLARREKRPDGQLQDVEAGIFEGVLVVDLYAMVGDNTVIFGLEVKDFTVETPDVDPRVLKVFKTHGLARILPLQVPLSWGSLLGEHTSGAAAPHVQNCSVAYTGDLSTFALRIQLGGEEGSGLVSEWTDFHAGNFPNRLRRPDGSDAQWGVLLSPALVESLTLAQIEDSLAVHTDEFRLNGGVSVSWAPDGSVPHVLGSFYGTVLIPCRPQYHVTFDGRIEVTAPNSLVSTSSVDWHGNTWDLALCETEVALSGGVIGAAAGASFGGPLGGAIGFVVGLGVGFIGGLVVATVYTPDLSTVSCSQDGHTLTCTRVLNPSLSLGPGLSLPVELTSAVATEDGLVMRGTYALPLIPALAQTQVVIDTKPFSYTELPVNCGNLSFGVLVATSDEAAQFTHAEAAITVQYIDDNGQTRTPPAVTATLASSDPENVFPVSSIRVVPYSDRTVIYVSPMVTQTTPVNYWLTPYGCTLRVSMVVATRTVSLPAPTALSAETLAQLRDRALRTLNDCLAKQKAFGKHGGRFDVEWLVDPGPVERESSRLWQLGVIGLAPREQLHAEDLQGQVLATSRVDARGTARVAVLTAGGAANQQLMLHRIGGEETGQVARRPDIRLKQTELIGHGLLVPGGRLQSVNTLDTNGRLTAAVMTSTTVMLYDVTFPNSVRGYFRADVAGMGGMALFATGIALWGEKGLTIWSLDRTSPRRIVDAPVHSVRVERGELIVTTDQHILGIDRHGSRAVRLGRGGAIAMAGITYPIEPRNAKAMTPRPGGNNAAFADTQQGPVTTAAVDGTQQFLHAVSSSSLLAFQESSRSNAALSTGSGSTSQSSLTLAPALEYFGVGSTLLVATADGLGLHVFGAGQSIQA